MSLVTIPRVVLTSNNTRELSDALRRRCLYHYRRLSRRRRARRKSLSRARREWNGARGADRARGGAIRREDLRKTPGVAETLDWAAISPGLGVADMRDDPEIVHDTLISLLKTHEDRARLTREVTERLVAKVA